MDRQLYFTKITPDGQRLVSWRVWVLIWVTPVLFLAAGLLMTAEQVYKHLATVPANGEVVRVYAWDGETVFDRGTTNYGPVFRYEWTDGQPTEASVGQSHPDWNFDIGSRHAIRYFPGRKADVVLPGPHNWYPAAVILAIGAILTLPALWGTARLRRWRRGAVPS